MVWLPVSVALVCLCGAILLASFFASDATRNDFERFDDLRRLFLFFALFVGLCAVYVTLYSRPGNVPRRAILATTGAAAALLLASFPVGSKDVFGYAFFGKIWGVYHANPYVVTPADFPADPWQPFLQVRWRNQPVVYGPLFLWQSRPISVIAGDHLWAAIWLHKACATIVLLASLWIAQAILAHSVAETAAPGTWWLALLAWNPLLLFESASGAHNDVTMWFLLLCALWGWRTGRCTAALCVLALSFWYKWYGLLFVPAFLIDTWKQEGARTAVRRAAVWLAAAGIMGLLLLGPLPGSLPTVISGLLHPGAMRGIYPNELSPLLAAVFWPLRVVGLFETDLGFRLFDGIRVTLFAAAVIAILIRQWRAAPSFSTLTESCCLLAAAFFLLLITMLLPWHLLTVIGLAVLCRREPFLLAGVVLTVLGLLSYFLTFAVATLMLGVIVATLWMLRHSAGGWAQLSGRSS
jgi:hypothetical protein